MINRNDIEITAPVGSFESLMAAVNAGADSVYFGIENLNMRSRSSQNFNLDDLKKIASVCKDNGKHSYLALNTVIYNEDIDEMKSIVDTAVMSGVDSIIASDYSVINYANMAGIPVHISTQCNVSNIEAVRHYSKFSDVIVLARELKLEQVREICDVIEQDNIKGVSGKPLRIEIFIHGALCMAVSGKCYMSLHENNHSANRGECLQTCRKSYIVTEKSSGYQLEIDNERIMSPKDLCTIGFIDKVIESGARVLKIEGRGRAPEYVKRVVEAYNEAINSYIEGSFSAEKAKSWEEKLATVFNRGFWDGYYLGRRLGEWSEKYGSSATKKKLYVGKATNYYSKPRVASFIIEDAPVSDGDELIVVGPTTGVVETIANNIRVDDKNVDSAVKGDEFSIAIPEYIRRSDKLYKLVDNKR